MLMTINNQILSIVQKAINAQLSLEDLMKLWPEELDDIDFYESIFLDVESSVEHFTNYNSFISSENYSNLIIDAFVLKLDKNIDFLNTARQKLLLEQVSFADVLAIVNS
jgi:hypothetical protein